MSTLNIQLLCRRSIDFPELAIFDSQPGAMFNLHWLELPIHGPKGVWAIEVWLYIYWKCIINSATDLFTWGISAFAFFRGFLFKKKKKNDIKM